MKPVKVTLSVIAGLAFVVAVVLGGWQAGWWFKTQNTNRNAHLLRNSYGSQQSIRDDIAKNIGTVNSITVQMASTKDADTINALGAQRKAVANIVCRDADQITGDPLPQDQATFVSANCLDGSVSPSSSLYGTIGN